MHLVRWLSRFLFLAFGLCLLSCSGSCLLYLHNDTSSPFEYKISANMDPRVGRSSASGHLANNNALWPLSVYKPSYASPDIPEIDHVDLEITQNGKTRKHRFERSELPPNMSKQSGYGHSYIKVTDTDFVVGAGSGNWGSDINQYGLPFLLGFGLVFVGGVFGLVSYLSKQKKKPRPRDQSLV